MSRVSASPTAIDGLVRVELAVHADERGWFKENWQVAAAREAGLPELDFVQQNVAFNHIAGVLRGIHVEPWAKYVSVACGRVFAAVVDLRDGPEFGRVVTVELTPQVALLIPPGCGNSYQTLEDATAYIYLTTGLWTPGAVYPAVDPYDPDLAIHWPIGRERALLSAKDLANPPLSAFDPLPVTFGQPAREGVGR